MPTIFAAELVDLILSFVHSSPLKCGNGDENYLDKSTAVLMGRCGLVCRAWLPSSRRILFYRVQVLQSTAYGFAKLLKKPDRLTFLPFIRELVLARDLVEHRWMVSVFPKLVPHLPSTIHLLGYRVRRCRTPENPYTLPCPKLPGITHLDISDINEPTLIDVVHCVSSFPALQALRLWVYNWGEMALPVSAPKPPDTLRSLDLNFGHIGLFLDWIHSSQLPITSLALFFPDTSFADAPGEIEDPSRYIEGLGASLTSLKLGFEELWIGDLSKFLEAPFLQKNTQLQALSIQSSNTKMISLLRAMHPPPTLKYLTMAMYRLDDADPADKRHALLVAALNSLLVPLASVKQVKLVHVYPSDESETENFKEQMLPMCNQWGGRVVETESRDVCSSWFKEGAYWDPEMYSISK
ncbi:hypothetical protein MVEN_01805500 [Mycena venus]|uniref:F-box domain-containing protein n=1 Tax=Mycena venus TaxID=2733690 RepID=A0A8H7CN91_9AGAR|nr:hypothetical protein MVEN_01805500 [Mycena venus]